MRRRTLLRAGLVVSALALASAHTPYRQWQVYRRKHLLIGTSKADAPSYPLGKQIADLLATHLPESSARVARGPTPLRLASLLTTDQLEVALLSDEHVTALRDGAGPFEDFGPTLLTALFRFGGHWLVCRPDFPDHHAWQVVRTLTEHAGKIEAAAPAVPGECPVPVHAGALAYAAGKPEPAAPPLVEAHDFPENHGHPH